MNAQLSEATQPTLDFKKAVIISVLLTPKETAKLLHVTVGTLAVWRSTRRKPLAFIKMGWRIFYRPESVQSFILAQEDRGDGKKPKRLRKVVRA